MTPTERARPTRAERRARATMLAERAERIRAMRRSRGETRDGIQLDSPESVAKWDDERQRPRCPRCGNPARWSTIVKAWCHADYHPDFDPSLPMDHNVGEPEWVPLEYAGEQP